MKAGALASIVATASFLTACSALPSLTPDSGSSPQSGGGISHRSPLEVRGLMDSLDVFGDCVIGDVRKDVVGHPTEVACYVLPLDEMGAATEDERGVVVVVYKEGQNSQDAICRDFTWTGSDRSLVTDKGSFFAIGRATGPDQASGYWPKEVWPEDVQRVLGGAVVSYPDFCA
jgi:hypothetical protein